MSELDHGATKGQVFFKYGSQAQRYWTFSKKIVTLKHFQYWCSRIISRGTLVTLTYLTGCRKYRKLFQNLAVWSADIVLDFITP